MRVRLHRPDRPLDRRRRAPAAALLAAAAAVAVAACGGGDGAAPPAAGRPLLPDLDQAAPAAVALRGDGGRLYVTFASAVQNVGRGPLLVESRRTGPGTMQAEQVLVDADGAETRRPLPAPVHFVTSETHRHWHLLGFDRYTVVALAGGPGRRDRKTGFCLGDRYRLTGARLAAAPEDAVITGDCGKDEPELDELRQGISVGYGDDYVPWLEGQRVDVTGLPAGRYRLVHRADPDGILRELSPANNAASVVFALRPRPRPSLRVLATCPGDATCLP